MRSPFQLRIFITYTLYETVSKKASPHQLGEAGKCFFNYGYGLCPLQTHSYFKAPTFNLDTNPFNSSKL